MDYPADVIVFDVLIGVVAVPVIVTAALLLGGFSFFAPWALVGPIVLLAAGLLRARSEGGAWLKSIVISLPSLIPAALLGTLLMPLVVAPFLVLPCAGGMWIIRRNSLPKPVDG